MNISTTLLRQSAFLLGVGLTLQASSSFAARCEYLVQSDWNTGFVAAIRITNDTSTAINGWSVNWAYTDGSTRTSGWNANVSGSNPYTATGVGWNSQINPGQSVEFGVQGNKGVANSPAQRPVVSGAVCSGATSSVVSSTTSKSLVSSSSLRASSSFGVSSSAGVVSSRTVASSLSSRSVSVPSSSASSTSSVPAIPSSSSASSVEPNTPPVAVLDVTVHGMTVFIDGSKSTDAEGPISYKIYTGDPDRPTIFYPSVWNTYQTPGEYSVTLEVWDKRDATVRVTKKFTVQPVAGNKAPIAMLTAAREYSSIIAHATASFDPEGIPLTYEWDFGQGAFAGNARTSYTDCQSGQTANLSALVTLTVSDGELKDTRQISAGGPCGTVIDILPLPQFSYRVEGSKVLVDGRKSTGATGLSWDFGDGSPRVTGVLAEHSYTLPGTYNVELSVSGPSLFGNRISQSVVVDFAVSSVSSSSRPALSSSSVSSQASLSRSSSSVQSSLIKSSSAQSSSLRSSSLPALSSSSVSSIPNHYNAPRATTAPVIDGNADAVWERAAWAPIDVFWLGTQANPSAQDYSGRYKALWDEDYLYLLFDVTDDRIYDGVRDALDRYWEDDTVELFIDENKNGGQHGYNTSAWAYHISTYGDVVDYTTSGPKLLNDHVESRLVGNGSKHLWEIRVRIYGEDYADWKANTPLKLFSGKLMGFSACYIDNDGSPQRESMMGSVNTQGHKNNLGYQDASVFGSLRLVE